MKAIIVCLAFLLALSAGASEARAEEKFQEAMPGRTLRFPRDHYAHPEFRLEWWYYTGNLVAEGGKSFGYELTFFRFALTKDNSRRESRWAVRDLYFSHLALTDKKGSIFNYREKISRGSLNQAGAATDHYHVWIDDWEVKGDVSKHHLKAGNMTLGLELQLSPLKPAAVHGENGVSRKSEGEGLFSHYYSLTRMQTAGVVFYNGIRYAVKGSSWMDHEFGSSRLAENQAGWDWFGIQLDNHTELMLYIMRHKDGSRDTASSGSLVSRDGRVRHLKERDFKVRALDHWKSPHSGAVYPSGWILEIPSEALKLEVLPAIKDQELITRESTRVTYWEGSVSVKGDTVDGPVTGKGYVELTGYAPGKVGSKK